MIARRARDGTPAASAGAAGAGAAEAGAVVIPLFTSTAAREVAKAAAVVIVASSLKRIAIDGDLAFVHARYLDLFGQETAGVDIFRFDADGKIVEHWDVLQVIPADMAHQNGMF